MLREPEISEWPGTALSAIDPFTDWVWVCENGSQKFVISFGVGFDYAALGFSCCITPDVYL
jgi:hypothetical protein